MVGTTQGNEGNGAEPRRPKKNRPKGPAKTSKAEALAQLVVRPDLATNVSAAVRLWGVSRSTARTWMAERAAMAVPPEPPLAEPAAMAASSPEPATAMSEPPPAPPPPLAGAMASPSHDEPFQAEPPRRDEEPRQEAPMAATMVDGPSPGDGASSAMAALADPLFPAMAEPVATPSPAMAATVTEPALVEQSAGVPAPLKQPEWHILWHRTQPPTVPTWLRQSFGGLSILLSFVLFSIGMIANMLVWAGPDPNENRKAMIFAAAAFVTEVVNYAIPSVISFASSQPVRRGAWVIWFAAMVISATGGAAFVKDNLGAAEASRKTNNDERDRLNGIVNSVVAPISDASVVAAREKRDAAKAVAKATCAPTRTLDVDECKKAKAAWLKAEDDFKQAAEKHDAAVAAAEQQHRDDVAKANADLKALPVTSNDKNVVLAGVAAIVPLASEDWVNRLVVALWIVMFNLGCCVLLRLGVNVLAAPRTAPPLRGGLHQ